METNGKIPPSTSGLECVKKELEEESGITIEENVTPTANPNSSNKDNMLKTFIEVASFLSRCEDDDSIEKSPRSLKQQVNNLLRQMQSQMESLQGGRRRYEEENRKLEEKLKASESVIKQQEETIEKLKKELLSQEWENFDFKKKVETMSTAIEKLHETVDNIVKNHLKEAIPTGDVKNGAYRDQDSKDVREMLLDVSMNMKRKMLQWTESQKSMEADMKKLTLCVGTFLPAIPLLCAASNKASAAVRESQSGDGEAAQPKKRVRFSSELVRFNQQPATGLETLAAGRNLPESVTITQVSGSRRTDAINNKNTGDAPEVEEVEIINEDEENQDNSNENPDLLSQTFDVEEGHGPSFEPPPDIAEANPDGSKKFWCLCGKGYSKKHDLGRHLLSKQNGKIFGCPVCPKVFSLHKSVKRHVRQSHKMEYTEGNYGCRVCGATYMNAKDLSEHRKIEHPGAMQFLDVNPDGQNNTGGSQRNDYNGNGTGRRPRYLTQEEVDKLLELDDF